jgi:hypothetical protein
MAIEMQGEQHYKENSFFGKGTIERDSRKRNFCQEVDIELIEVPYKTVISELSIRKIIGV